MRFKEPRWIGKVDMFTKWFVNYLETKKNKKNKEIK